jgi:Aerotolerance regulator N-terminal/von Willebrand factor type A domain
MLSLLNPSLLPWLAAISIPVLLHLLTRRTRRRVDLPTLRFLQRSLARQSRLFRWRHLLLLLLRALAVAALVTAFTRPALRSPLAAEGGESVGVVLLLDLSASMSYHEGGLTALETAKGEAVRTLRALHRGDRANVVLCGAQPATAMSEPTGEFGLLQQAVRAARVTEERGDPAAAVNMAVEQLAKTNTRVHRLYVFSDFQRTNWAEVKFTTLGAAAKILFVNTASEARVNAGLTALRLRPATPRAGETVTLSCEVFNSSPALRSIPVTLQLSNGLRRRDTAVVGPYSSANVSFPLRFDTPQRLEATVSLPADALATDDSRRAVIDLQRLPVVLLLTDENAAQAPAASFFLTRALRPDPRSLTGFQVTPLRPAALNNPRLQSADAVIVCNAPGMPPVQYEALARYVQNGGNLVWFLYGDRVPEQLRGVGRHLPAAEPMPLQVESVADLRGNGKGYVTLAEARYESSLLKAFKDPAAADLSRTRFYRFCITSEVAPRAETLLKFEDGTAAAVRAGVGSGNLLLVNMAPAPSWSDLARQEAFLPLMHEFLKGLLVKDVALRDAVPGGPASTTLTLAPAGRAPRVLCTGPEGNRLPVVVDPATGAVVIERAARSGFYRLTDAANGEALATLTVNPHPDESDLRAVDPRELESRRRKGNAFLAGVTGQNGGIDDFRKGRPVWHYFLLVALACLLAEQWVGQLRPRTRG